MAIYDVKLDPLTGDYALENGDLAPVADRGEAIRQDVETFLATIKGEWFLDRQHGVDYHGSVFGRPVNLGALRQTFKEAILSRPGIASVDSIEVSVDAEREATIEWEASSDLVDRPIASTTRVTI